MSFSLYDFLKKDIRKMVHNLGPHAKGNIYPLVMQEVEKYVIGVVLQETRNNYFRAAQILGISRSTLYRKIETLKLGQDGAEFELT